MYEVTRGLQNVYVYLEDTLFCNRRSKHGVTINTSKCELRKPRVTFLGYTVSSSGMASLLDNVTAILGYPTPHAYRQSQQLVGLVDFYQRFISDCTEISTALIDLQRRAKYKFVSRGFETDIHFH